MALVVSQLLHHDLHCIIEIRIVLLQNSIALLHGREVLLHGQKRLDQYGELHFFQLFFCILLCHNDSLSTEEIIPEMQYLSHFRGFSGSSFCLCLSLRRMFSKRPSYADLLKEEVCIQGPETEFPGTLQSCKQPGFTA